MVDTSPLTREELQHLLALAFAEARRAIVEPDRAPLALKLIDICHNVPRILSDSRAGMSPLRVPRGAEFPSVDAYWRSDLVPLFAESADTQAWIERVLPRLYGTKTTVFSAPC